MAIETAIVEILYVFFSFSFPVVITFRIQTKKKNKQKKKAVLFSLLRQKMFMPLTKKLIWLDVNVNSEQYQLLQKQFRYELEKFDDIHYCERYIQTCSSDNHLILILHDRFSENLIPKIHDYRQIQSIYIYSLMNEHRRSWLDKYDKVIINEYPMF